MLPKYYKFYVLNSCGQTLAAGAVDVDVFPWKFDSGARSDGTKVSKTTAGTVATGAGSDIGTVIDNTSDLHLGAMCLISVTTPASADGDVTVYIVKSGDNSLFEDSTMSPLWTFEMGASETQVKCLSI